MSPSTDSPSPVVEVRGLDFEYSDSGQMGTGGKAFRLALPSWKVDRGERWALHGPSGCGKSTLLDLVAGVLLTQTGQIWVEGVELGTLAESERRALRLRRMGFVFQDFPLVDYLDALDNVLLPYRLHRDLQLDAEARSRALDLLGELGLQDKVGRHPRQLSQGERQRLAIARALVTEPSLLLADEPTAGLDPGRASAVLDLLEGLSAERGSTLLFVTHDPEILSRFDRRMNVGQLSDPLAPTTAMAGETPRIGAPAP